VERRDCLQPWRPRRNRSRHDRHSSGGGGRRGRTDSGSGGRRVFAAARTSTKPSRSQRAQWGSAGLISMGWHRSVKKVWSACSTSSVTELTPTISLARGWQRRPRLLLTLWGKFQACLLEDLSRSRVNHSAATLLVGIFLPAYLQSCECGAA